MRVELRKLAKKCTLLPLAAPTSHGAAKPDIEIGSGRGGLRVSALYLDDIKTFDVYGRNRKILDM